MILEQTEVMLANGSDQNSGKPIVFSFLAGATESDKQDLFGSTMLALIFPTSTTTATFTIKVSIDDVNYYTLKDGYTGNPITIDAIANDFSRVLPQDLAGVKYAQLVSSTPQVSAIQVTIISGQVL